MFEKATCKVGRRFRGESVHKVDAKGRVSIPAPFRRVLEEGDPDWSPGKNPTFVIIYGDKKQAFLRGYSIEGADALDDKVAKLGDFDPERRILERMLNAQSVYASVDENGRIVLSQKLREKAGIAKEATFAGMGDKFEIWNPDRYEDDMEALQSDLDGRDEASNPFMLMDRVAREG